jgi:hypothetical protein
MSIPAAAMALGTIRAMIKRGQLRTERVRRPQGYTLRVYITDQVPAAGTPDTSDRYQPLSHYWAPTNDLQRAEALAAYGATLLAPVLATIERREAANRAQAETIGELRATLEAATQRPWWTRLAWWRRCSSQWRMKTARSRPLCSSLC